MFNFIPSDLDLVIQHELRKVSREIIKPFIADDIDWLMCKTETQKFAHIRFSETSCEVGKHQMFELRTEDLTEGKSKAKPGKYSRSRYEFAELEGEKLMTVHGYQDKTLCHARATLLEAFADQFSINIDYAVTRPRRTITGEEAIRGFLDFKSSWLILVRRLRLMHIENPEAEARKLMVKFLDDLFVKYREQEYLLEMYLYTSVVVASADGNDDWLEFYRPGQPVTDSLLKEDHTLNITQNCITHRKTLMKLLIAPSN